MGALAAGAQIPGYDGLEPAHGKTYQAEVSPEVGTVFHEVGSQQAAAIIIFVVW